jgi:hypothetical protein
VTNSVPFPEDHDERILRHSAALEPFVFGGYDMLTGHPIRFRLPERHPLEQC